jgi:predicted dehydrogenase
MDKLKVGIIGTGFSANSHLEAIRRLHDVEVVAIAASTNEKAKEIAQRFGIPKYYSDPSELISDSEVEVVHNCTPNYLHFPINREVLLAGKHLLSEKPLAMNSEESQELLNLAQKQNVVAGICFNYRFYPLVAQAREYIKNGDYGRPHIVYGGYVQDWCLYDSDYSWRMDPEKNGPSRAIADIGSHWCDTIQYILGKNIVEVFADLKTVHPIRKKTNGEVKTFMKNNTDHFENVNINTEDYGSVLVHFEDGTHGVFTVSQVSAGRKNKFYFDIATEKATLSWDQEMPNQLWIGKRDEPNHLLVKDPTLLSPKASYLAHYPGGHQEGWPDGLKNLFINFYETISKNNQGIKVEETSFATINDGHQIMNLIQAIMESHRTKKWISIPNCIGAI